MAQGFIKNRTQPTDISSVTTVEIGKTVATDDGHDARSKSLPNAGSLSHVEIILTGVSAGTAVTFDLNITYDSAGKDPVLPPLTTSTTTNTLKTLFQLRRYQLLTWVFGFSLTYHRHKPRQDRCMLTYKQAQP